MQGVQSGLRITNPDELPDDDDVDSLPISSPMTKSARGVGQGFTPHSAANHALSGSLTAAVGLGDLPKVRSLLCSSQGRMIVNAHEAVEGYTPLMAAVALEDTEISLSVSQCLLEAGAEPNAVDLQGNTSWHWVARLGNHTVLKTLLNMVTEKQHGMCSENHTSAPSSSSSSVANGKSIIDVKRSLVLDEEGESSSNTGNKEATSTTDSVAVTTSTSSIITSVPSLMTTTATTPATIAPATTTPAAAPETVNRVDTASSSVIGDTSKVKIELNGHGGETEPVNSDRTLQQIGRIGTSATTAIDLGDSPAKKEPLNTDISNDVNNKNEEKKNVEEKKEQEEKRPVVVETSTEKSPVKAQFTQESKETMDEKAVIEKPVSVKQQQQKNMKTKKKNAAKLSEDVLAVFHANHVGDTPLHEASREGHTECCELLVQFAENLATELDQNLPVLAAPEKKHVKSEMNVASNNSSTTATLAPISETTETKVQTEETKDTKMEKEGNGEEEERVSSRPPPEVILRRNDLCVSAYDEAGRSYRAAEEDAKGTTKDTLRQIAEERLIKRRQVQALFCKHYLFFRTLLMHHNDCFEHKPVGENIKDIWEAPARLVAIMDMLSTVDKGRLTICDDFEKASIPMLELAHSPKYVNFVHELSTTITPTTPVPFTPRVQECVQHLLPGQVKRDDLCDTSFSKGSLAAAKRAAGSVCHAIDKVMVKKHRNAFCIVRPPGHHAGIEGLIKDASSCGFCIFNNVMVGALSAMKQHPKKLKRIAIIDFDVHHGNGTEEIVMRYNRQQNAKGSDNRILFFSSHIYDAARNSRTTYEFYPGSGKDSIPVSNVINVPLTPLWRRRRARAGARKTWAERFYMEHRGRNEFRRVVLHTMTPALRAFNPDLVMISAGFDAGAHDVGNGRYLQRYNSGFNLRREDYFWVTAELQKIADMSCDGRMVSVLEGGYGKLMEPSAETNTHIDRSSLARNVIAHITGLLDTDDHTILLDDDDLTESEPSDDDDDDDEDDDGRPRRGVNKDGSTRVRRRPARFGTDKDSQKRKNGKQRTGTGTVRRKGKSSSKNGEESSSDETVATNTTSNGGKKRRRSASTSRDKKKGSKKGRDAQSSSEEEESEEEVESNNEVKELKRSKNDSVKTKRKSTEATTTAALAAVHKITEKSKKKEKKSLKSAGRDGKSSTKKDKKSGSASGKSSKKPVLGVGEAAAAARPGKGEMYGNLKMKTDEEGKRRELKKEDALHYLKQVKELHKARPETYRQFLSIMGSFKKQELDVMEVIEHVKDLFHGDNQLIMGFNTFLPEGYQISLSDVIAGAADRDAKGLGLMSNARVAHPVGVISAGLPFSSSPSSVSNVLQERLEQVRRERQQRQQAEAEAEAENCRERELALERQLRILYGPQYRDHVSAEQRRIGAIEANRAAAQRLAMFDSNSSVAGDSGSIQVSGQRIQSQYTAQEQMVRQQGQQQQQHNSHPPHDTSRPPNQTADTEMRTGAPPDGVNHSNSTSGN